MSEDDDTLESGHILKRPKSAHIHVMGFRESTRVPTGIEKVVWRERRRTASPDNWVLPPVEWDTDMKAFAALIGRNVRRNADIYAYCYSWGCGNGFVKLAKALQDWELNIKVACLCDPVYHGRWRSLSWRAMVNAIPWLTPKIRIPRNVEEVRWCRQFENKPQGHDLVAQSSKTVIQEPHVVKLPHTHMDDSDVFASICRSVDLDCCG